MKIIRGLYKQNTNKFLGPIPDLTDLLILEVAAIFFKRITGNSDAQLKLRTALAGVA